jgi:hypothetical protein
MQSWRRNFGMDLRVLVQELIGARFFKRVFKNTNAAKIEFCNCNWDIFDI